MSKNTTNSYEVNIAGYEQGYPNSYFNPYQNEYIEDGPQGEYLTDRLTDEAIQILEDHREEPFFLYLSYYAVHSPYQCKPELKEKYESKPQSGNKYDPVYAGMLETMDTNVGKLLQKLKDYGLEENTLVIFYSDNGAVTPVTSAEPLRGSKGTLYQGGILAPLIVKYPKFIQPGSKNNYPVNHIDILPTIAEFAGAGLPENQPFDGISMMELLKGENIADERSLFWHFPGYLAAYQNMEGVWRSTPSSAIIKGNWKLIQYFENDQVELFDLVADPYELNNLAGQNQEKARELKNDLQSWRTKTGAKVPQQLNPDYDTTRQITPIDNPIYKYW